MAGEPTMTLAGNLTDDPELRFTPSGAAVANFTVASTPRNKQNDEWVDGTPMFMRCSIWRAEAENVAESLQKGMRVVVHGRVKCREWEDRDGNKRTSWEMDVDEIGPSLKWATAKVTRTRTHTGGAQNGHQGGQQRSGGQQGGQGGQQGGGDPWGQGSGGGDPWGAPGGGDEPPF